MARSAQVQSENNVRQAHTRDGGPRPPERDLLSSPVWVFLFAVRPSRDGSVHGWQIESSQEAM